MTHFNQQHAQNFVSEIPTGTAERVYASDFNQYCRAKYLRGEENARRPIVQEYGIGSRVAEYLRNVICRETEDDR